MPDWGRRETKTAKFSIAATVTTEVVAAVSGKSIHVVAAMVTASGAGGSWTLKSTTTTSNATAAFSIAIGGPHNMTSGLPGPLLKSTLGEGVSLTAGATSQIDGMLWYYED